MRIEMSVQNFIQKKNLSHKPGFSRACDDSKPERMPADCNFLKNPTSEIGQLFVGARNCYKIPT